jgi:hypothetical protein
MKRKELSSFPDNVMKTMGIARKLDHRLTETCQLSVVSRPLQENCAESAEELGRQA